MSFRVFSLLMLLCSLRTSAQSYIEYQRVMNRCDNDILTGNYELALRRMDTIDRGYEFVFARHCVKALQIAIRAGDHAMAAHWLQRGFVQGVPGWTIRHNPVCRESLAWQEMGLVMQQEDSLHAIYRSHIDTVLAEEIGRMSAVDAWYTRRVNDGFFPLRKTLYGLQWVRNNTRQVRRLEQIILERGYPEEKLIGLPAGISDSSMHLSFMRRAGIGLVVQHRQAFFMFLHYFSTRRKDLNALLEPQIITGNMPAHQFARLNDYLHDATSRKLYPPYFDQRVIQAGQDTTGVAGRRAAIGLSPIDESLRNRAIKLEREFSGKGNEGLVLE